MPEPLPSSLTRPFVRTVTVLGIVSRARARGAATRSRRAVWHDALEAGGLLVLVALAACSPPRAPAEAASNGSATTQARVAKLIELWTPLPKTVTSDISDKRFIDARALEAELSAAGAEVGREALVRLRQDTGVKYPQDVERALLTVAAKAAPEDSRVLLENLVTQYGTDLGLRTEATLLLAEVHPARALELLEPYVRRTRQSQTLPPAEFLVRAWVTACEKAHTSPVPALVDVATNLFMEEAARTRAIQELGNHADDPLAAKAVSSIVIESTGDGYLRRKAVQSLVKMLPRETACTLLTSVADKEADTNMLLFLKDVLDKNCSR